MHRSKKGVLGMMTVIAIIAVVGVMFYGQEEPLQRIEEVGQLQNSAVNIYARAQMMRNYLESAAELSLRQAANMEGTNAGNFEDRFADHFNNYMKAYPADVKFKAGQQQGLEPPDEPPKGEDVLPASLFDRLQYDYDISLSPQASVRALPKDAIVDVPILDEDTGAPLFDDRGELLTRQEVVPTVLKVEDPEFRITYTINAYIFAEAEGVHVS